MPGIKNREFAFDKNSDQLFRAVLSLKDVKECEKFFRDVLTLSELQAMTERFTVAKEINAGKKSYREINDETGVSTATIARIASWLRNGCDGYKLVLERTAHHA